MLGRLHTYGVRLSCQGHVRYELIGDFPAPYFFSIDASSGTVKVKNNLKADKALTYKVLHFTHIYFIYAI